jgi:chromosome segregation ATPase
LQASIRELTAQLQKLSEVNLGLIARIKEVEAQYSSLRAELEQKEQEERRKLKYSIYNDV